MQLKKLRYLLLLGLLLICSCTQKKNNKNSQLLRIGVMSSMDYLPLAVAKEQNLFEEEGVEVVINKFYSANERDAAFQSGNLDGTILDYTGAAIQRAGGVDLKLTSQCDGSFVMVANRQSSVKDMEQLVAKKIAVSRNTIIDFCTDLVLQQARIPLKDVEKVEINKIPLRLEMLMNGKIDATMLPDPFATIALQNDNFAVVDIEKLDVRVTGIAFHNKSIDEKREAIESFYRAYNRAVDILLDEPVSSFHELLIAEVGVPAEFVSHIHLPRYTKASLPQIDDLKKVAAWLKSQNLVPSDFDIETLLSTKLDL